MPRIAGYLHRNPRALPPYLLEQMGSQLSVAAGTASHSLEFPPFSAVWRGAEEATVYKNNAIAVVLDGSLYNTEELDSFPSSAELIARLYLKHGFEKTLQQINGDFSIVLYDSNKKLLFLARDRFGIRPLYYSQQKEALAFASTPWALFRFPGVSSDPRRTFVALYAGSNYRTFQQDSGSSAYQDISQIPQAHFAVYDGKTVNTHRYWDLDEKGDWELPESTLAEMYQQLLQEAVKVRLKKATRPAFTLSGGMDSSSVLSLAKKITGNKQHAFSCVYEDKSFDESEEIKSILPSTVEQWHALRISPKHLISDLSRAIRASNEPVATSNYLSHFLLCEQVSKEGFTHLFGGLGGDELNAGEFDHFFYFFADLKAAGKESQFKHEVAEWSKHHDHPIYKKNLQIVEDKLAASVDLRVPGKCLEDRSRIDRYQHVLNPDYFRLEQIHFPTIHRFHSYLKNRTYQEIYRETVPPCLSGEDRNSSYFGLQNILPFFDYKVVEFMFRVPTALLTRDGITKQLLRAAMKGIVCEETRTRVKKVGWNAPAHLWFNEMGFGVLSDFVHSQEFRELGIYQVPEVIRIMEEHKEIVESQAPRENHMMFLWQLLNLQLWFSTLREAKQSSPNV